MTKVKLEYYKTAYEKLYRFLRYRRPEVLNEYREYLRQVKLKVEEALLCAEEASQ